MKSRIDIIIADITTLMVDAIVNAANSSLLGGGGVDGAIHRAAGPQLVAECRDLRGCKTGQAKITHGYKLPVKYVIHTVGPVWNGGHNQENELLHQCYKNSLQLAEKNTLKTIAFPAISTGIYRFPPDKAAQIAVQTVFCYLTENSASAIEKVIFCCFSESSATLHQQALDQLMNTPKT